MSLTQLASMFIGSNSLTGDDLDKLTGVSSKTGNIIHITNGKNDNILGIITARNILFNVHHKSLKDNFEIFDFECLGERNYDDHLIKGNRLVIPGEFEEEYIEFVIDDTDDRRSTHKHYEIKSYASYLDLQKAKVIEPFTRTATAREHLIQAFSNTEHEVGVVESDRMITLEFENHTNPLEYARRVTREFDLELNFRVEHNGLRITNRVVDALDRVGAWRGREITFGKDLQEINRLESGDVYTALIGLGPEHEDGTRLQVLVEDFDALRRWGRPEGNPQHLIGVYEPTSDRDNMTMSELRQYTQTELDKRKNSVINYEINFLDLEHILGHENKKIRFGDTIRIKDTMFEPNLYVEARIFEMKRNVIVPAQKEFVLGDFVEFDADTIHSIYDILKRQLAKKAGLETLLNYAEPKKIESPTAPVIKEGENPIWVDTSRTPNVAHVVVAGKWVKMTPTTPAEVDAYTKKQIDDKDSDILRDGKLYADEKAQAEAEQALKDAKAFSKNASNINEGVINVGAIPLRTSITGARLEWDGVNGLVQYDALGNPVSWLDLDANAHFANAFLSGRIEANAGFFGDNLRLVNGKIQIVRPDDAIWLQDGMVRSDYTVSSYDPHNMTQAVYDFNGNLNRFSMFGEDAGFYRVYQDVITGRDGYVDQRDTDKGHTVRFNSFEFIHNARYLIIGYRKAVNSSNPRHQVRIYEGDSLLYTEWHDRGGSPSYAPITIDLGIPTYARRTIELRLGVNRGDASGSDRLAFRLNRVFQTDFI